MGTGLGFARAAVAVALTLGTVVATASAAWAHTEFESSDPADGAEVDGPLAELTLTFTAPATESGDGIQVFAADGTQRAGTVASDGALFRVTLEPPLEAGGYGVRWEVRAGDAHPIDGSFRFTVTAPAPSAGSAAPTAAASPTATPTDGTLLDERLAGDHGTDLESTLGRWGRGFTITGTIVGIGTLAVLAFVLQGRRSELRRARSWLRACAVLIVVGGLVELAATVVGAGGGTGAGLSGGIGSGIGTALGSTPGVGGAATVLGGVAVALGFPRSGRLVPAGPQQAGDAWRWAPSARNAVGVAGIGLVLASFWFDGHTASKGPWPLHAAVNSVHLLAAGTWAGGVLAITLVALGRRRRREPVGAAGLVVRFSSVATVALAPVVLAGVAMAALVLDSPSGLVDSAWGRLLLAKTSVVLAAMALGAYNHVRLRPALIAAPQDPALARRTVRSLVVEALLMAVVIALTVWLVDAAT